MKNRIIYLTGVLLVLCISPAGFAQSGVQKDSGSTKAKKQDNKLVKKPPVDTSIARPDLTFISHETYCGWRNTSQSSYARVVVKNDGGPISNSFVVRLQIHKERTVVETLEKTVTPFSGSVILDFQPQTEMIFYGEGPRYLCRSIVDVHNQVTEKRENNNLEDSYAPSQGQH